MSPTDNARRFATCANVADCAQARAGTSVEWYAGAGEYCPECGEALLPGQPVPAEATADSASHSADAATVAGNRKPRIVPHSSRSSAALSHRPARPQPKPQSPGRQLVWLLAAVVIAGAVIIYALRRGSVNPRDGAVAVCPIPGAQQLAADLVRGYAAQSGLPSTRFVLATGGSCDVRFSTVADQPDAIIAHDGIVAIVNPLNPLPRVSEKQLRGIFSGSIRDWSQLGAPSGPIAAFLPDAGTDEFKVLASSLFFGVPIDPSVRRGGSSADVTRAVTGVGRDSHRAIGLVAFSQAVTAKVVPLTYLPPPNVLSIGSRRYPYTLTIAVASGSEKTAATGLIQYARSSEGAAIVLKNGLVPREGL